MTGRHPSSAASPSLTALEAALDERDRHTPPPSTWMAALGVAAIATSTLLYWALAAGPVGTLAVTGPPMLLWVGLIPAAGGVAVGLVRPLLAPARAATVVLVGALVVAVAVVGEARSAVAGPAPWLALAGAVVTGVAAATAVHRGRLASSSS